MENEPRDSAVIRDTGIMLRDFIKANTPVLAGENQIVFKSPAELETATTPLLSLFLYHLPENGYLRNADPVQAGKGKMRPPPVVLDLHYLLTPYAPDQEQELLILESLIRLFYDRAVFEAPGPCQDPESGECQIRAQRLNLSLEEMTKLWERFPHKPYKLSLAYAITPVRIPSGREDRRLEPPAGRRVSFYKPPDGQEFFLPGDSEKNSPLIETDIKVIK